MKTWTIIATVLGIIIIIGVVLLFLIPKPAQVPTQPAGNPFGQQAEDIGNTAASPANVTLNFYKWYLSHDGSVEASALSDWLTPAFVTGSQTIRTDEELDPFLLSQDVPSADASLSASLLNQSASDSTVRLVIQASDGGATYTVHLLNVSGQWRIDSISKGSS